jgi:hypothetical protein
VKARTCFDSERLKDRIKYLIATKKAQYSDQWCKNGEPMLRLDEEPKELYDVLNDGKQER